MYLEIVTPEASLVSGEVESLTVPGVDGEFQMLNNHAPIVSTLKEGLIKITALSFDFNKGSEEQFNKVNDQNYTLAINSGTIELKDNKVIVLVD